MYTDGPSYQHKCLKKHTGVTEPKLEREWETTQYTSIFESVKHTHVTIKDQIDVPDMQKGLYDLTDWTERLENCNFFSGKEGNDEEIYRTWLVRQKQKSITEESPPLASSPSRPSEQQGCCEFPHFDGVFQDFKIPVWPLLPVFSSIHRVIEGYSFITTNIRMGEISRTMRDPMYDAILAEIDRIRLTALVAVSSFQRLGKLFRRIAHTDVQITLNKIPSNSDVFYPMGTSARLLDTAILSVSLARELGRQTSAATIKRLQQGLDQVHPGGRITSGGHKVWLQKLDKAAKEYLVVLAEHHMLYPMSYPNDSDSMQRHITNVAKEAHTEHVNLVYGIGDITAKNVYDEMSAIMKVAH